MAQRRSKVGRIAFEGARSIRNADATRAELIGALSGQAIVEVDCAGVTEIDLSFVQLLLAARKSALVAGKSFSLAAPATGVLQDVLVRGGFLRADGPSPRTAEEAFWLMKESTP